MLARPVSRLWYAVTLPAVLLLACDASNMENATDDAADSNLGRQMYRDGILPSGEPLTAIVAGDVPVLGTQFSCESCHGRSGMGAAEGAYIVPPIAGQFLFAPSPQPVRPAYDQQSLARLLRDGVTPGGRQLGSLMPRYELTDDEVAAMTVYLAGLSSGWSPGVDDKLIRFATVFTDDVTAAERDAVLAVLNTFFADKNSDTRLESERWDRGSRPASRLQTVHRDWVLDVWTLTGAAETWSGQLESYYQESPVFAMLSGLSNSSWGPVGRFCERNEIPCLFPGTDLTERADGDFYTLYYSRGLDLEAGLIANHLATMSVPSVIQVFCGNAPERAAAGLKTLLEKNETTVHDLEIDCSGDLSDTGLAARMADDPDAPVVLWLGQRQAGVLAASLPPGRIYFSSTLLGDDLSGVFPAMSGQAFVAHPYRLPGRSDPAFARFSVWAKTRGIELTAPRHQSEAFFACLALKDAIAHLGRFFVRDYALDMLDHAQSIVAYLPYYPRPTLGPGQRFVNKGGYVLPIINGRLDTRDAAWILP